MLYNIKKYFGCCGRNLVLTVFFVVCGIFFCMNSAYAGINSLRVGQGVGSVRLVFDSDQSFDYKVFLLSEPRRLIVDTQNIKVNPKIVRELDANAFLKNPRLGTVGVDDVRIAFDLSKPVVVKKAFLLAPQSSFGWRFVVDLELVSEREFASRLGSSHAITNENYKESKMAQKASSNRQYIKENSKQKKIIVLDPGHGGHDPGAIGYSGVYEKNITLAFGRELKALLDKTGKYKVYLTRSNDKFIPLRDRVKIARKYKADLFMSLHADSAKNRSATGLSVYTLSETASDKEAAALAERENKADVIAGLNLVEHSKEVSDILINLAQRETMNRSSEFAGFMVEEMKKKVKLVNNTHRFAGFAVLKGPDVPAVLLEMGYLSNRQEEKQLQQKAYRKKLGEATVKAIDRYFDNMQHASVF